MRDMHMLLQLQSQTVSLAHHSNPTCVTLSVISLTALTIQDSVVAVNRDCEASLPGAPGIIDNKAMHVAKESSRSGSVSESESEGSGVALLKEISKNTEVIAKAITKPDVMAHNLLARIDCRTEETCALANHIGKYLLLQCH